MEKISFFGAVLLCMQGGGKADGRGCAGDGDLRDRADDEGAPSRLPIRTDPTPISGQAYVIGHMPDWQYPICPIRNRAYVRLVIPHMPYCVSSVRLRRRLRAEMQATWGAFAGRKAQCVPLCRPRMQSGGGVGGQEEAVAFARARGHKVREGMFFREKRKIEI